tara:strand:+ start:883 stop:1221 length:339 start_codon:yes stop_codon:yes gene_type:complete
MTSFCEKLIHIKHATSNQRQKEVWNVEGIIEGHSNQRFRFDTRPLKNDCKKGYFKTKADKIVFDIKNQFIIVDVQELHQYLKDHKLKKVYLEELISNLEWSIILPKYRKPGL